MTPIATPIATIIPRPDGLFAIRTYDGAVLTGEDERGLTKERAEEIVDELERRAKHVRSAAPLLPRGRRLAGHL